MMDRQCGLNGSVAPLSTREPTETIASRSFLGGLFLREEFLDRG